MYCCSVITLLLALRQAGFSDTAQRFVNWSLEFCTGQGSWSEEKSYDFLDRVREALWTPSKCAA